MIAAPAGPSSSGMLAAEVLPTPERRTPPRPAAPAAEEKKQEMAPSESKKSAAMEEMSRRAAQVRGVPAEGTPDGVAPVLVPRKPVSADSPAAKALAAKKEEIAKKIASGSVAAPSKSMAVGAPSRLAGSSPAVASPTKETASVAAPSIKERYATEGSAPVVAKPTSVKPAATPSKLSTSAKNVAAAMPAEVKEAQAAVQDALKDVAASTGKAIHIHVHAPVHIHIGGGNNNSKL